MIVLNAFCRTPDSLQGRYALKRTLSISELWHQSLKRKRKIMPFWKNPRKNKLNNQRHTCRQGHIHQSKLEAGHCDKIELMLKAGEFAKVETQVSFPLYAKTDFYGGGGSEKVCAHIVDKLVTYKDGRQEVIETKGFSTDLWALKKKIFEANYPNIKYTCWYRK